MVVSQFCTILTNMTEDERQYLLRTVAEAHTGLSEVAFKLRRELTPKAPALKQAGVFHGFLPTPSFRCTYTGLGRLLSLATPAFGPLEGRVF